MVMPACQDLLSLDGSAAGHTVPPWFGLVSCLLNVMAPKFLCDLLMADRNAFRAYQGVRVILDLRKAESARTVWTLAISSMECEN